MRRAARGLGGCHARPGSGGNGGHTQLPASALLPDARTPPAKPPTRPPTCPIWSSACRSAALSALQLA